MKKHPIRYQPQIMPPSNFKTNPPSIALKTVFDSIVEEAKKGKTLKIETDTHLVTMIHKGISILFEHRDPGNAFSITESKEKSLVPMGVLNNLAIDRLYLYSISPFNPRQKEKMAAFLRTVPLGELERVDAYFPPILYHNRVSFTGWNEKKIVAHNYPLIYKNILEALLFLNLNANGHVLDVACGTGNLAVQIAEKFNCQICAFDADPTNVANAQKLAQGRNVLDRLEIRQATAQSFIPSQKYDFVILSGLLNQGVVFNEADAYFIIQNIYENCLKKGGKAVIAGRTPSLFRSAEFKKMGFSILRMIDPQRFRSFYVLKKEEDFFGLPPGEIASFAESFNLKTKQLSTIIPILATLKLNTPKIKNDLALLPPEQKRRLEENHQRLGHGEEIKFFKDENLWNIFQLIAMLEEVELPILLPGLTRLEIFYCLQNYTLKTMFKSLELPSNLSNLLSQTPSSIP